MILLPTEFYKCNECEKEWAFNNSKECPDCNTQDIERIK